MKKHIRLTLVLAFGLMSLLVPVRQAAHAQGNTSKDFVAPVVFQAAGSTADSIQSTVDAFRALWAIPTTAITHHRSTEAVAARSTGTAATPTFGYHTPVTPFNTFLNNRGSQFTTPGIGLSQAPPSGGPQGGLAALFNNPTYEHHLQRLQPVTVVHSSGQQHHRSFVLRARHQWA